MVKFRPSNALGRAQTTLRLVCAAQLECWLQGYSRNEDERGGNQAWFLYTEGSISVKNPDQELLITTLVQNHLKENHGGIFCKNAVYKAFWPTGNAGG